MLTRVVIYEFTQALKSKVILLDANFVTLISFILQVRCIIIHLPEIRENLLSFSRP